MECENCGKQYDSDAIYCSDCGSKLIHRNVASDSTDLKKGKISEFVFMLFGFVSLIALLISTVIGFNVNVDSWGGGLPVLLWWMIGACSAFSAVISFFVFALRKGNIKNLHGVLIIVVIFAVAGSCFSNFNQVIYEGNKDLQEMANAETVRQRDCVEPLEHANDRVNEAPGNIDYIVRLADIQVSSCFTFFEEAYENYEKAVFLYESKQETTEEEKHSYMNALYGLIDSQMFNVQVIERCTIPSHSDADGNFIAGRQDQSCMDLLVAEFEKNKEKYQSKCHTASQGCRETINYLTGTVE